VHSLGIEPESLGVVWRETGDLGIGGEEPVAGGDVKVVRLLQGERLSPYVPDTSSKPRSLRKLFTSSTSATTSQYKAAFHKCLGFNRKK